MMRASIGNVDYWNLRIKKDIEWIDRAKNILDLADKNPLYRPQFTFDLTKDWFRLSVRKYSCGATIQELSEYFCGLLDAWELSNRLSDEVCAKNNLKTCRDWVFELSNLNHYNWCFWLVGLALSLNIPGNQWQRLLVLIDGEGEDILLDRIIASRQPGRRIGNQLLHKKPYARLLKAIDAPPEQQGILLREFVDNWYPELERKGKEDLWWYTYGDPVKNPLEMGSYFGRWCIEAVAAVKAFGLDDSLCLGHEHYPGDLLRPDGPTTHLMRSEPTQAKHNWVAKIFRRGKVR